MNQVAVILDSVVLYRYALVLALSGTTGVCFFMACCSHRKIPSVRAAAASLTAVVLSLLFARLVYWYGRPDRFSSLFQALTTSSAGSFALAGAFAGCGLAALLHGGSNGCLKMLDCMSVAGCGAIALGRLGCFFTDADRGPVMKYLTSLPWAYPITNVSGQLEYRFATFLFQAAVAAVLMVFLAVIFFRKYRPGDVSLLFILIYSASQVFLDSTRYDSLHLRCNGFISVVQLLSALGMAVVLLLLCIRVIKMQGLKLWMIPLWILLAGLLFGCGYMEYYVQRHGREIVFAYSIMSLCLLGLVTSGILLWWISRTAE